MAHHPEPKPPLTPREQKKLLLTLVIAVLAVHATAIAVYRIYHIPDRPVKTQETFVGVWVLATLIVITPMMKRIRQSRRPYGRRPN